MRCDPLGLIYERLLQRLFTHCISGPPRPPPPEEPARVPAAASAASLAVLQHPRPPPPPPSLCPGNPTSSPRNPGAHIRLCLPQPALLRPSRTRGCSAAFTRGPLFLREATQAKNRRGGSSSPAGSMGPSPFQLSCLINYERTRPIPARDDASGPSAGALNGGSSESCLRPPQRKRRVASRARPASRCSSFRPAWVRVCVLRGAQRQRPQTSARKDPCLLAYRSKI